MIINGRNLIRPELLLLQQHVRVNTMENDSRKAIFEELVKLREESEESLIEHPKHYQGQRFEVIDIIEDFKLNFHLGNAIKYILRAGRKDDRRTDLQKAIWYLQREVDNG